MFEENCRQPLCPRLVRRFAVLRRSGLTKLPSLLTFDPVLASAKAWLKSCSSWPQFLLRHGSTVFGVGSGPGVGTGSCGSVAGFFFDCSTVRDALNANRRKICCVHEPTVTWSKTGCHLPEVLPSMVTEV